MTNSWTKLADGSWGVRCATPQVEGTVVTVTSKSGETKQATIGLLAYEITTRFPGFVYNVIQAPKAAAPAAQAVGDLSGVLDLFKRAKGKLKFPAIVLSVPAADTTLRLTIAGAAAKVPGSVTVTSNDKVWNRWEQESTREWLGRVLIDGTYQPARAANGRTEAIANRLRELAQEPAKVAAEYGRLTGCCCFCNAPLGGKSPDSVEGRKSLAVGYGRTCARNWGLPWGEEKFTFKAEEV